MCAHVLPPTATYTVRGHGGRTDSDRRGFAGHLDLAIGHRVPLNNGRHSLPSGQATTREFVWQR
jgi:hypothetical protein